MLEYLKEKAQMLRTCIVFGVTALFGIVAFVFANLQKLLLLDSFAVALIVFSCIGFLAVCFYIFVCAILYNHTLTKLKDF